MAIRGRRLREVVHHSDHETQYTSLAFGKRCWEAGVKTSMGTVGDGYDNALCESFFATLECEFLWRGKFMDRAEARREVFRFIEGWYNRRRHHSGWGIYPRWSSKKSTGKRKRGFPKSTQPEGPQSGWRKRGYDVRSAKLTYVPSY
jgi:transposase InsO family protein